MKLLATEAFEGGMRHSLLIWSDIEVVKIAYRDKAILSTINGSSASLSNPSESLLHRIYTLHAFYVLIFDETAFGSLKM